MNFDMWSQGLLTALQGHNILYVLLGTLAGLVVGALPGLGPLFGVAIMLPFTFGMPAVGAIIFLAAVHSATAYGDSIASILINTPGGVGSIATCWDGYPMSRQGKSAVALGISATGSLIGGIIGWIILVLISPALTDFALKIGPAEYFVLGLMALSLLAIAAQGETIKGLILGCLGLLLSFVGQEPVQGTLRFTLGLGYLEDGFDLVPVTVGLLAISQALILAEEGQEEGTIVEIKGTVWEGFKESIIRPLTIMRSGIIGILLGIMPALGISVANIVSYLVEKKYSKNPDTFGKGNPAGVLAPETSKSACIVGDLIPTFTLGIPGSAPTAVLLAALTIHGLQPGPHFFLSGSAPYAVFWGILLAQFTIFILGLFTIRYMAKIIFIPKRFLATVIIVLSLVGAYADQTQIEAVYTALFFGLVGYILNKLNYPSTPLILGLVVGHLVETNFQRAMIGSGNSYAIFVTRPISLFMLIILFVFMLWPYIVKAYKRFNSKSLAD